MKIYLIVFVSLLLLSSCNNNIKQNDLDIVTLQVTQTPTTMITSNTSPIILTTKDGQMEIKLYDQETPKTAANFRAKVNSGFYDGLIFHRVIPGFMAQGGDPTGTGMGGGKQPSELNTIPFKKGSLGLARTAQTNQISNDSQFYICFDDTGCTHLTGDYVNFGEVVSGFDVLAKIAQGDKMIKVSTKQ